MSLESYAFTSNQRFAETVNLPELCFSGRCLYKLKYLFVIFRFVFLTDQKQCIGFMRRFFLMLSILLWVSSAIAQVSMMESFDNTLSEAENDTKVGKDKLEAKVYPNNEGSSLILEFVLSEDCNVHFTLHDFHGRTVADLGESHYSAGTHLKEIATRHLHHANYVLEIRTPDVVSCIVFSIIE